MPDLEQELDRLYGLPPDEFTPARNDLAKRLRKAGEREAADRVAGMRRPPVSAWALNQLARRAPEEVAEADAAGRELVEAQTAALGGGGDARAFEAAQRHQREAVRRLTRTAAGLLEEAGHRASAATLERIASSLRAASVDEEGRRLLERGRFEDDFEGGGLLALAGLATAPAPARRRAAAPGRRRDGDDQRERERRREELREELRAARARVREAEKRDRAAQREAAKAEEAAAGAREAAERAERHAEVTRADAREARSALEQARAAAEALEAESPT